MPERGLRHAISRGGVATDRQTVLLGQVSALTERLKTLAQYLNLMLGLADDSDSDILFAWDHEMIFEVVHPFRATSVYSGILWHGLQCLKKAAPLEDESWRIILPEGTRIELERHLESLVRRYSHLVNRPGLREPVVVKDDLGLVPVFQNRPDYQRVNKAVAQLNAVERSIARLVLLLQQFARPLPFTAEHIPSASVDYYRRRLSSVRNTADDRERNEADALNLASVETINTNDPRMRVALVTATKAVASKGGTLTRDPLYFALEATLRLKYPRKAARDRMIMRMISRLYDIVTNTEELYLLMETVDQELATTTWPPATHSSELLPDLDQGLSNIPPEWIQELELESIDQLRSGALMGRSEVATFLTAVKGLQSDPVLMELALMMAEAAQAAQSAAFQASAIEQDLAVLRVENYGNTEALLDHISYLLKARAEGPEARIQELTWQRATHEFESASYSLVDRSKRQFLEAEVFRDRLAVAWVTNDGLDQFCSNFSKLTKVLRTKHVIGVLIRFPYTPGAVYQQIDSVAYLEGTIRDLAEDKKISLIQLTCGSWRMWFDPGEIYAESSQLAAKRRQSRIAIHITEVKELHALGAFVSRSSSRWMSGRVATQALDALWKDREVILSRPLQ